MKGQDGFMRYARREPPLRPLEERIRDWGEVYGSLSYGEVSRQAERCMGCGIPYCHAMGCPAGNLIPEVNSLTAAGKWKEAYQLIIRTNPFPEITGRICPAPCESSCTLSINDAPVTIRQIERAVGDRALEEGWAEEGVFPDNMTGRSAAVIGSGPAGLAAAWEFRSKGYAVTVFEKSAKPGGILKFGIPDFKLEKKIVMRRVGILEKYGVVFETGTEAGVDISADYIRKKFDIILITTGAGVPRDLSIPGRELGGIYFAMEYLAGVKEYLCGIRKDNEVITAAGKNVLIIGGGDTGADCAGTARRQGARNIYQLEIMPRPSKWEKPWNPQWPFWPLILRTSTSHNEGVARKWAVLTERFTGEHDVSGAEFVKIKWPAPSSKSKFKKEPGSRFKLETELVLISMGYIHTEHSRLARELNLEYDEKGNIKTRGYMTEVPGVFAAGDASSGASLVVRAVMQGREAALAAVNSINDNR